MTLTEIYAQPLYHRFRAPIVSKASFFILSTLALTIICPLLVAYRSEGLWLKTNHYREQAEVHFKHRLLIILWTENPEEYLLWSSYPALNAMEDSRLRIPLLQSEERDFNRDSRPDQLFLSAQFPKRPVENVIGLSAVLLFDYQLELHSRLRMEALAHVKGHTHAPSAKLAVSGDLRLVQKTPLWHRGIDRRFNYPAINGSESRAENFRLENILQKYSARNLSTRLDPETEIWAPIARNTGDSFRLELTLNFPLQTIEYRTGFWELIKWAWIQYLSILIIFAFVLSRIRDFVFTNRLLPVID